MVCSVDDKLVFGLMVDVLSMEDNREAGTVACPTKCDKFKGSEFQ